MGSGVTPLQKSPGEALVLKKMKFVKIIILLQKLNYLLKILLINLVNKKSALILNFKLFLIRIS